MTIQLLDVLILIINLLVCCIESFDSTSITEFKHMVSKMDVVVLNLCFVTLNSPDEMRCLVYFRALRFVDSREPTLELGRDQAPGFLESFLFGQKLDA